MHQHATNYSGHRSNHKPRVFLAGAQKHFHQLDHRLAVAFGDLLQYPHQVFTQGVLPGADLVGLAGFLVGGFHFLAGDFADFYLDLEQLAGGAQGLENPPAVVLPVPPLLGEVLPVGVDAEVGTGGGQGQRQQQGPAFHFPHVLGGRKRDVSLGDHLFPLQDHRAGRGALGLKRPVGVGQKGSGMGFRR